MYCNLRTGNRAILWTVLEWANGEIGLSFEYGSCSLYNVYGCRIFICDFCYCGTKVMKMGSSSSAVVCLKFLLFCRPSGWSVGSFYLLIVLYIWFFWCWELLIVRWCSFRLCLTLWLGNRRRQVDVMPWSTSFHSLFVLPLFNFRIHMSQITW
jgi:hypothetical protein